MCPALLSALPVRSWGGPELCHELRVYRKDQELALCSWAPCTRGVVVTGHCCGTPILLLPVQPPPPCECAPARQPVLMVGCGDLPSWHIVTVPAGTGFATQPFPIQVLLSISYPGSPYPSPLQVPLSIPYPLPIQVLQLGACTYQGSTAALHPHPAVVLWERLKLLSKSMERAFTSVFCYSKPVTCHVLL